MADTKALIRQGEELFSKRSDLVGLWQEIAENFYPQRADFTVTRSLGADFAAHLNSSYPVIVHRDLSDAFSSMLRPRGKEWFRISIDREENLDRSSKEWLEEATKIQRRAMYDRMAQFVRATKEGDKDFAAFGQCVLTIEMDRSKKPEIGPHLLYRCHHLRDVAWCARADDSIGAVHHKWKPTVLELVTRYRDKVHPRITRALEKEPYRQVDCRYVVVPTDEYADTRFARFPYAVIAIDVENNHVMEERGSLDQIYVIPRWATLSGSQYAYSPAATTALPDARLLQAMTLTLLEAGEMAVRPPMLAVREAIRSDVQLFAGGITWTDAEYDERLGEALRPVTQDKSGLPFGIELSERTANMLASAWYLNKLTLPPAEAKEMTAFETGQRIEEYIRQALPLFEPMEVNYNAAVCEVSFEMLMARGAFGPLEEIPAALRGREYRFVFESPLQEATERKKSTTFLETKQLIVEAAELDPASASIINVRTALRDALDGLGTPAKWQRDEAEVEEIAAEQAQAAAAQQAIATAQAAGQAAEQAGKADAALAGAEG
jgi:hypothetical protein